MVVRGAWVWVIILVGWGLAACSGGHPSGNPLAAGVDGGTCGALDGGFPPGVDATAIGSGAVSSDWETVGSPTEALPVQGNENWGIGAPVGGKDGQVVAAWFETDRQGGDAGVVTYYVRAARVEGTSWTELTSSTGEGVTKPIAAAFLMASDPAAVIGPSGEVIVAWWISTMDGHEQVHVRRYDGHDWSDLGEEIIFETQGGPDQRSLKVALRSDGTPVVAFGYWRQIYVRAWDGTAWTALPDRPGEGGVYGLDLAIDSDDRPVIASISVSGAVPGQPGSRHLSVVRLEGKQWTPLGGGSAPAFDEAVGPLRLRADSLGRLIVAFIDNALGATVLRILRFDGNAWTQISSTTPAAQRDGYDIATQGAELLLVWSEGDSEPFTQRGLRLNEAGWQNLMSGCNPSVIAKRFGLSLNLGVAGERLFLSGQNAVTRRSEVLLSRP